MILQGGLGGLTVLLLLPPAVSILHACLAQTFFCLTVVLASVTGPGWRAAAARKHVEPSPLATSSVVLVGAVFAQLILGAVMRHPHAGLAIPDFPLSFGRLLPSFDSLVIAVNFAHRAWGLVVAVLALRLAWKVWSLHRGDAWLMAPVRVMAGLVPLQVLLGAFTIWSARGMYFTTLHVAGGAALLATCLTLSLRIHRLRWLASHARGRAAGMRPATLSGQESPT